MIVEHDAAQSGVSKKIAFILLFRAERITFFSVLLSVTILEFFHVNNILIFMGNSPCEIKYMASCVSLRFFHEEFRDFDVTYVLALF